MLWSHRPDLLVDPHGKPRYAAIGLPSRDSIRIMLETAEAIDPHSVFLVGDLRADAFLAAIGKPNPTRLGVYSGWRKDSLFPALKLRAPSVLDDFMNEYGFGEAVVTVHPRVESMPFWRQARIELDRNPKLTFLGSEPWEPRFATCSAYFGDRQTSMLDLLALSGRPIFEPTPSTGERLSSIGFSSIGLSAPGESARGPDWEIGTAAASTAKVVAQVIDGTW